MEVSSIVMPMIEPVISVSSYAVYALVSMSVLILGEVKGLRKKNVSKNNEN